jgi:tetratricopeptide (TPR) repeat protein
MKEFGLTPEETRIMFSYQYHLVQADIDSGSNYEKNALKREWLSEWKTSIELFLNSQIIPSSSPKSSFDIITDFELLTNLVKSSLIAPNNQLTRYLILVEVTLFQPYYPLGDNRDKAFKNLKITDEERLTRKLKSFALTLDIEPNCVIRFKTNYKEAIKGIKDTINPLLVGVFGVVGAVGLGVAAVFATPLIVALLAPILAPGLYGAAAVAAVLAALGGGAIAAGGFGMAGGMAVIVAGGSLLGAGAGVGVGALFSQSPDAALTQAAKLEVVIREILFIQKDSRKAQEIIKPQEIIKQLRLGIRSLEDQRDELLINREKNQKEIENLTKAIEYLKKALERLQGLM